MSSGKKHQDPQAEPSGWRWKAKLSETNACTICFLPFGIYMHACKANN